MGNARPGLYQGAIGSIQENIGNIHYSKGEVALALQKFNDSLQTRVADLGVDHPDLADIHQKIGNCFSDQFEIDNAITNFNKAIGLKEADPEGGPLATADVLTIEGILNNLNGDPEEGLENYERALQILVTFAPDKKEKIASLLHLIGCVYLISAEHKKAMILFKESLQARRKVLGCCHLDVANTLFNMAFLYEVKRRNYLEKAIKLHEGNDQQEQYYDKAMKCLEEALKIRELRLPNSEKEAVTHEKIGKLSRELGKIRKAEIHLRKAFDIRTNLHGNEDETVAAVLQELGVLKD